MKYRLDGKITPLYDSEPDPQDVIVETITSAEYKKCPDSMNKRLLLKSVENAQYCKADVFGDSIVGTFVIPDKTDLIHGERSFGFSMKKGILVFVDDGNTVDHIIKELADAQILEKTFIGHLMFEFMEYLIKDDVIFLQDYEKRLAGMEDELMKNGLPNFNEEIQNVRRELLVMESYYRQLLDLSDTFDQQNNCLLSEADERLFSFFLNRVGRLCENVQMLKEYSIQLREMYQSQIDIRQNKIMQFLTVVTTVFMPLTLIAGWYGMNFINMPELQSPYGYWIIIAVSIATILIEIWYFKIKKWLD